MIQTFGDVIDKPTGCDKHLILEFSPYTLPLSEEWRNNSLLVNFMANYLNTLFSTHFDKPEEFKQTVKYVANELLENAVKFYDKTSLCAIGIQLYLYNERLIFFVTNSIHLQAVDAFQAYLQVLTSTDPQELWQEKLANKLEEDNNSSGLGLLTMLVPYEAKLGWKF
ncbi:MAG: ATP-binding protein [Candidatus Parabeggiatoa sp. nov. 1]|nr:MAG: ATP-binding protein [Gammaproteobacteria bacterium]